MWIRADHPEYLWLLAVIPALVIPGWRWLWMLEPARRWTILGLRAATWLVLVLTLSGLELVREHDQLTVIAVVDGSESARRFGSAALEQAGKGDLDQWLRTWLTEAAGQAFDRVWARLRTGRRPEDRIGLVRFDGRPTVVQLPSGELSWDQAAIGRPVDGTDAAAAIRLAMALFPTDSAKRLLLVWDGNATTSPGPSTSDVLAAAREAQAAGIPIDVLPIEYRVDREVLVEDLIAPPQLRQGQTAALRIVLSASHRAEGQLHVKHNGVLLDLTPEEAGTGIPIRPSDWVLQEADSPLDELSTAAGGRFRCVKIVELPLADRGLHRFEAIFEPAADQDSLAVNNSAQASTLVWGRGKILVLDGVGGDSGAILPTTLRQRGLEVQMLPPQALPTEAGQLLAYDAIVLHNVAAEALSPLQQKGLVQYVHDLGGGLVMIGGPDSFGAGGWANSPVEAILPVSCQLPAQTVLPAGALVIVMDRSGSMGEGVQGSPYTKQEIANEAAVLALTSLYPQDLVGVVAFDHQASWIVGSVDQLVPNNDPKRIAQLIRSIQPGGGTNIYPGLEQAYLALARLSPEDAAVRHIILLTDGQSQEGPYFQLIGKMVQAGITLSTVGVGNDVNHELLEQLAKMAGGAYHPVSDPKKLPQIFIREARTVRRNLIKEVPFVPRLLASGSPVTAGLSGVPELRGLVVTAPKNDPRLFMPMLGPDGEPLFAHWQVGLGRAAAFTSDATNRWAAAWLSWPGYADFWARTVRMVARPATAAGLELTSRFQGQSLHLRLEATSESFPSEPSSQSAARFLNFLSVRGSVLTPDGQSITVQMEQTGPGVYEASIPALSAGSYLISLIAQAPGVSGKGSEGKTEEEPGETVQRESGAGTYAIFSGANRPVSPELRVFRSNRAVLEQIAQMTGGRVLDPGSPTAMELFARQNLRPARALRPLWPSLLVVLLVLLLMDVAVRRIAWDARALAEALGQWLDSLLGILRVRTVEAEATLQALRKRVRKVEQRLRPAESSPVAPSSASPTPAKRFQAKETFEPAEDTTKAIGAAQAAPERSPTGPGEPEKDDLTRRLLETKRRLRQQLHRNPESPEHPREHPTDRGTLRD